MLTCERMKGHFCWHISVTVHESTTATSRTRCSYRDRFGLNQNHRTGRGRDGICHNKQQQTYPFGVCHEIVLNMTQTDQLRIVLLAITHLIPLHHLKSRFPSPPSPDILNRRRVNHYGMSFTISAILQAGALAVLILLFVSLRRRRLPPGPRGNVAGEFKNTSMLEVFDKWRRKYGT